VKASATTPAGDDSGLAAVRTIGCIVADDHPAILDSVCRLLEGEAGFELLGRAADGESAYQLIIDQPPQVALLDIRMSRMGGIEVAAKLAATAPEVAVVLFTAHADRALLLGALDAGVRGFILKDAPLEELLRAIRLVAAGGSYIDPSLAGDLAGPARGDRVLTLTKREREVLKALAEGMRDEQAGRALSISPLTVRTHVQHIMEKLRCETRTQAVAVALRESLIE
jgi:DNA-binding NarL/FixJ family response regulator